MFLDHKGRVRVDAHAVSLRRTARLGTFCGVGCVCCRSPAPRVLLAQPTRAAAAHCWSLHGPHSHARAPSRTRHLTSRSRLALRFSVLWHTDAPFCCAARAAGLWHGVVQWGLQCHEGVPSGQHRRRPSGVQRGHAYHGKRQLLHPATPYYPSPRGNIHTMGNIWSFTVGRHECCDPTGVAGSL